MLKDSLVKLDVPLFQIGRVSVSIIVGVSLLMVTYLMLPITYAAQAHNKIISAPSFQSVDPPISEPCVMTSTITIAGYQAWHGLSNHMQPPPYESTDPAVIARHIEQAKTACIDVIAPDWYGPSEDGLWNDMDRAFIDKATAELIHQAEEKDIKVALMYDLGTLNDPDGALSTTQVISDLLYAKKYFTSSAYLQIDGHPALFIFPYEAVEKTINWTEVRQQLGITLTIIDKDLDLEDPVHDDQFDGFYAWVRPDDGQWSEDGLNWGGEYLRRFYTNMATVTYTNKTIVGGAWPGFDDSLASWGDGRIISRRCGETWTDTWQIAQQYNPPYVLISTWNDFEEGSDIEDGIIKLMATNDSPTILSQSTSFTATMSDCDHTDYSWDFGDGATGSGAMVSHIYTATGIYTAVVTGHNPTATLTTTVPVVVSATPWCEDFNPLYRPRWVEISAKWEENNSESMATLKENNPTESFGKVESEIITVNVDEYPSLRVNAKAVDPEATFTIQILDKITNTSKNVLTDITEPGWHLVNLADEMGWQGEQSFTINVWISGENKSATFSLICIERYKVGFLPLVVGES